MFPKLKPYAEYCDSDLDWIGPLPKGWSTLRAKYLYHEADLRSGSGQEELLSVSHLTGVTPRRQKTITMFLARSNIGHKICAPGDLVINTMWAWMAALGVSREHGIVSPAYGVYRPLPNCRVTPDYADYLLRTALYAAEYQRRSTGVNSSRMRLYPDQFLRVPVIIPSLGEQEVIVRFLNWMSRRLDAIIREKKKELVLVSEYLSNVTQRAMLSEVAPVIRTG